MNNVVLYLKSFDLNKSFIEKFLLLIVIVIVGLRLTSLTDVPEGFFADEASIGYNAFSILETGRDEYGKLWPVYFEAFGEYKNPIFIYSTLPFIWLFGVTIFSLRLTSAFWGLGLGVVSYFFWGQRTKSQRLLTVIMVLVLPWTFHLHRLALELTIVPTVLLFHFFMIRRFESSNDDKYWWGTLISLGVLFYSYSATRLIAIVSFGWLLLLYRKRLDLVATAKSVALFFGLLIPVIAWEMHYPGSLLARYKEVSVGTYYPDAIVFTVIRQYLNHFNPDFLVLRANYSGAHVNGSVPPFLWGSLLFVFWGIVASLKRIKTSFYQYLLVLVLLCPIPAALAINTPNNIRSTPYLATLLILLIIGLDYLVRYQKKKIWLFVGLMATLVQASYFLSYYFTSYNQDHGHWFNAQELEAVSVALNSPDQVFINQQLHDSHDVSFLFLDAYPPDKYQTEELTHIQILTLQSLDDLPVGTFVFFYELCQELPEKFKPQLSMVFNNGQGCVYQKP